jgi:hypothetical protein
MSFFLSQPSISTAETTEGNAVFRIQMLEAPPLIDQVIEPPDMPNRIYGWFNGASNMVELYITNHTGRLLSRVGTYQGE